MGPGGIGERGGLHRVRAQPSPIMIYIDIIGGYMSSGVIAHISIAIASGCVQFSGDIIALNNLLGPFVQQQKLLWLCNSAEDNPTRPPV